MRQMEFIFEHGGIESVGLPYGGLARTASILDCRVFRSVVTSLAQ